MKKFDYEHMINKSYDETLEDIIGLHEYGNILKCLDCYIVDSIEILEKIYSDKDIQFTDYIDLSEQLSKLIKEMFRIVMR
jgi:hypothetical protein|nr:MAG TPA: tRNA nuclease CdiA [Caudoviricetes sp.]